MIPQPQSNERTIHQYDNPLIARYASAEMSELWSPQRKFSTWRRLWVALAEAEAELGLPITPRQIAELSGHVDDIDFEAAAALRAAAAARRDGPRPRLRRRLPRRPGRSSTSARPAAT